MIRGRGRIAALAAGALATGGIAAGAVAATTGGDDAATDLADAINERAGTSITADDVEGAYLDLLEERLDEAVAAGRLTQEQADEMLQRAQDAPGLPGLGGPGMHGRGGPGGPHGAVLDDVAATIGLSEDEIRQRLEAGTTLAQVAEAQGVARADLLSAIEKSLTDEGVDADRAAEMAERIADGTRPERGGRRAEVIADIAGTLKLSEDQIRQRLGNGRTLAQIAEAQGVGRAALLAAIETSLTDEGVDADRAAEMAERIADGTGRGPGHGHGPWGP